MRNFIHHWLWLYFLIKKLFGICIRWWLTVTVTHWRLCFYTTMYIAISIIAKLRIIIISSNIIWCVRWLLILIFAEIFYRLFVIIIIFLKFLFLKLIFINICWCSRWGIWTRNRNVHIYIYGWWNCWILYWF